MKHIVQASFWYVRGDQHWDICLQTTTHKSNHVLMIDLRLNCNLISKILFACLIINCNGALHRNLLVVISSSLVHLTEATLSKNDTIIVCDFAYLLLCEYLNTYVFEKLTTIFVEMISKLPLLIFHAQENEYDGRNCDGTYCC
ncbi:Os11g0693750 [Oryza sativa Japonica Group]|uniref:Os11g0693750 protein n=1 Tax=Oryza sativa subsp. japonica TaxID=39947 RepID=A0A0P0Y5J1_ORYSJ|nr:Os11g0693750 [Oryza sativa Japonica Group]